MTAWIQIPLPIKQRKMEKRKEFASTAALAGLWCVAGKQRSWAIWSMSYWTKDEIKISEPIVTGPSIQLMWRFSHSTIGTDPLLHNPLLHSLRIRDLSHRQRHTCWWIKQPKGPERCKALLKFVYLLAMPSTAFHMKDPYDRLDWRNNQLKKHK